MYGSCYLTVCLAAAVYCLVLQKRASEPLDTHTVVLVALSAFFDVFSVIMSGSSLRLIFGNLTNIDALQGSQVLQFAVRIPLDATAANGLSTITYPLPRYPSQEHLPPTPQTNASSDAAMATNAANAPIATGPTTTPEPVSDRDRIARHRFAIVRTEAGDNPWDLGAWKNWQAIMGSSLLDCLLPIRPPPCSNHDDMRSLYPTGPVFAELMRRHNLPVRGAGELGRQNSRQNMRQSSRQSTRPGLGMRGTSERED